MLKALENVGSPRAVLMLTAAILYADTVLLAFYASSLMAPGFVPSQVPVLHAAVWLAVFGLLIYSTIPFARIALVNVGLYQLGCTWYRFVWRTLDSLARNDAVRTYPSVTPYLPPETQDDHATMAFGVVCLYSVNAVLTGSGTSVTQSVRQVLDSMPEPIVWIVAGPICVYVLVLGVLPTRVQRSF